MSGRDFDQIKALCRRIHNEHDPEIFDQLITELSELLELPGQPEANIQRMFASRLRGAVVRQAQSRNGFSNLLESTIAATEADYGNVQVFNPSQQNLKIVAQRGFDNEFLDYFALVDGDDGCACGAALRSGARVVVRDTAIDPVFSEQERRMLLRAGVRSVQSTPMIDPFGRLIGVVSTHYRQPHRYDPAMGSMLDQLIASFFELRPSS